MKEFLLTRYFFNIPLQPHSLHLYKFAILEALTADSKKVFARLLLIVPIFPHEGHLEVSGNDLKKILSCKTSLVYLIFLFFQIQFRYHLPVQIHSDFSFLFLFLNHSSSNNTYSSFRK